MRQTPFAILFPESTTFSPHMVVLAGKEKGDCSLLLLLQIFIWHYQIVVAYIADEIGTEPTQGKI